MRMANKYKKIASEDAQAILDENLNVSFEYLDWDSKEFFFHGLEKKYYQKFFECITILKSSKETDITQQTHPSLSPKSIFKTNTSIKNSFPEAVILKIKSKLFVDVSNEKRYYKTSRISHC